jgi:hypothetical protein
MAASLQLLQLSFQTQLTFEKQREKRRKRFNQFLKRVNEDHKRRRNLFFFLANEVQENLRRTSQRKFWIQPGRQPCFFWENIEKRWVGEHFERLWVENFRISRMTFQFLCDKLGEYLVRDDTRLRKSISVAKRIAICLWHLATGEDLRSLAWRFDIGKSTACQIINEVCHIIVEVLLPIYVRWPTGQRLFDTINGFAFPQCAGAIDGTHIPIVAPHENKSDFHNRKHFYSVILQAVVDHTYRYA